ncbi:4322_t:CDS:1, partial [Acaulospora colombiana]
EQATAAQPMGTRLSQAHAEALTPTLWALLSHSKTTMKGKDMPLSLRVLQALIDQVEGSHLTLTTKSVFINFIMVSIL